jgi:hypothetical protein
MDLLNSGYDHAIRFLVPTHQRATFDRAVAVLPSGFLDFPATGETFESKTSCKARLQGFALGQVFAVVIGKCQTFRCLANRRAGLRLESGQIGEMDELVLCLREKKWMSIYVHLAT